MIKNIYNLLFNIVHFRHRSCKTTTRLLMDFQLKAARLHQDGVIVERKAGEISHLLCAQSLSVTSSQPMHTHTSLFEPQSSPTQHEGRWSISQTRCNKRVQSSPLRPSRKVSMHSCLHLETIYWSVWL